MKFLIYTFEYSSNCGGIIVLHKLCHLMRKLGHDAALWFHSGRQHITNPAYDTPVANGLVDPKDCCVIYPEIVRDGNPLGARVGVSWILYLTGDNDHAGNLKFTMAPHFNRNHPDAEPLVVIETYPEHCRLPIGDEPGRDIEACFIVRKGTGTPRIPETESGRAVEITDTRVESCAPIMRRSKRFYNYDVSGFHSLQAVLCGCESVMVPKPGLSRADWRAGHPLLQYGIAYGLDDLPWAEQTASTVPGFLKSVEAESVKQINRLVERVEQAAREGVKS